MELDIPTICMVEAYSFLDYIFIHTYLDRRQDSGVLFACALEFVLVV